MQIPRGIESATRMRISGKGEPGQRGGPPGDLYLDIHVDDHTIFEREGNNLTCDVPISFATASLGGEVEVLSLDKKLTLKIPPETQSLSHFRLRKQGMPILRSDNRGDLICRIIVETPVNLNSQQKEMLTTFANSLSEDQAKHSPKCDTWMNRLRKIFQTR